MNNIYVDELPKYCYECPCYIGINCRCKLKHEYLDNDGYEVPINCPLKLITDRLAEERKNVIERIRELAEIYTEPQECDICKGVDLDKYVLTEEKLNEILDQIERNNG